MQVLETGPDWVQRGDLRFDVEAKAEDPASATRQQLLPMLQNLLVERFQIKFLCLPQISSAAEGRLHITAAIQEFPRGGMAEQ